MSGTVSSATSLPAYVDLIYPTLRAVEVLGGSALAREITNQLMADLAPTDEMIAITYPGREKSVLMDRMDWARSYSKLGGALESPRRGLFLLSPFGKDLLALPEEVARTQIMEMDRQVRATRRRSPGTENAADVPDAGGDIGDQDEDLELDGEGDWRDLLLERLHRLSPGGFEEFVLYLLRTFGMELTRTGASGDEGVDGIGTAPISEVLSSRVAVQAKRYDPKSTLGREVVALFQNDARTKGAERAILVSLGRFSEPARRAAIIATPTVDLIDGARLCELVLKQEAGVRRVPQVDEHWFDRFD